MAGSERSVLGSFSTTQRRGRGDREGEGSHSKGAGLGSSGSPLNKTKTVTLATVFGRISFAACVVLGVLKTTEKKGQHRREKDVGSRRREGVEGPSDGHSPRCSGRSLPSAGHPEILLACQLHTIEFLGTVAAMAPHAYRARQRAKARAVVSKPHSVAGDGHHSTRCWAT